MTNFISEIQYPNGEVYEVKDKRAYHPPILSCMWSDHLINDVSWLRADTFSWQSGDVYTTVYDKLVEEYATGSEETEGSITFKRTTNGFKIATADYETAILNKYNTDGIAWYYILDTTNKRFKLPRTKFGFEGLRTNVGDQIAESLPNITGNIYSRTLTGNYAGDIIYANGAFDFGVKTAASSGLIAAVGSSSSNYDTTSLDASRSSSTYQNGAPVQERATQMYLYFYVGEYSQTAIEQTAGLNTELFNGKLDKTGGTMTGDLAIVTSGSGQYRTKNTQISLGDIPTVGKNIGGLYMLDKNGYTASIIQGRIENNGLNAIQLITRKPDNSGWGASFEFGTDANGKAYFNRPQIIADYVNGTSGYRIWSNGYCEQWGLTVSKNTPLHKTFSDTNFNVQGTSWQGGNYNQVRIVGKSESSITWWAYDGYKIEWIAKGYLAAGQY